MRTKIYILSDETGKIRYVGKTSQSLSDRLCKHLSRASGKKENNHRSTWIRSVLSRGFLPQITLVGEVEGSGSAEEVAWINYFRQEKVDLCNATDGGEGTPGYRWSDSARRARSLKLKGLPLPKQIHEAARKATLGVPRTQEVRDKISAARKGKLMSDEQRKKLSAAWVRRKAREALAPPRIISPETRAKISKAKMGHEVSLATRQKLREFNLQRGGK